MTAVSDLYLPKAVIALLKKVPDQTKHPGVKLDKLSWAKDQKEQIKAIDTVCGCTGENELLVSLFDRRGTMLDAIGAWRFWGLTKGSLTLHLSRANALENAGLALHPVYGFAWLPATGLKGMTRAWAETVWQPSESDQLTAKSRIDEVFGSPDQAGRVIFHDAWPIRWPQLKPDILNSHHSEYYKEGTEKKPPGDWEDPVPVYFFTVGDDTEFEFALSDRTSTEDGLLEQVVGWMCAALEDAGVGAKTAAGYGRIAPRTPVSYDRPMATLPNSYIRQIHRLTLTSAAFLAGAEQGQFDCDLRPASLRGLLRWWWRTMHAGHLSTGDLAKLEALIWGDAERGSAVSLSVRAESREQKAERYDKKKIKQASTLPEPKDRNTVQGLFYASYGMDERNSKARWYRHSGDSWDITLTSRETCWLIDPEKHQAAVKVPATLIMRQVEAALWLLARFGGAGSKARKGFGSFENVSVNGIDSVEDCIETGRELRTLCHELTMQSGIGTGTPALERRIGPVEIKTPWKDSWFVLDRFGAVYQRFVSSLQKPDREVLGLPRGENEGRLASPLHLSLSADDNKCLTIRLIAFPDYNSTTGEVSPASKKILDDLCEFVERELDNEKSRNKGNSGQASSRGYTQPPRPLEPRQEIQAELLEKKTKKGGWMAKDMQTEIEGNIENSDRVPSDAEPGHEVRLIVKSTDPRNASFLWPTPQKKEQSQRSAANSRRGGRRRR